MGFINEKEALGTNCSEDGVTSRWYAPALLVTSKQHWSP